MSGVTCERCGHRLKQGEWIYSRFSGKHYCANFNACDKRARRKPKAKVDA